MIRIPVYLGNIIEIAGLCFGTLMILFLETLPEYLRFFVLIVAWFCFWYFSHCLTHFIFGRIFGIRFLYYFVGKSAITKLPQFRFLKYFPVLGIKVDIETFSKISSRSKFIFYASGTFASMFAPTVCLIPAAKLGAQPFLFILFLCIGNIILTLYFSPRVGDLSRAKR
jgi:hypothetical protein